MWPRAVKMRLLSGSLFWRKIHLILRTVEPHFYHIFITTHWILFISSPSWSLHHTFMMVMKKTKPGSLVFVSSIYFIELHQCWCFWIFGTQKKNSSFLVNWLFGRLKWYVRFAILWRPFLMIGPDYWLTVKFLVKSFLSQWIAGLKLC